MRIWPFARSSTRVDAEALLGAVQAAARQPRLYGPGRVPDTLEGRFELMALFAILALIRLRRDAEREGLAQLFTDKLFRRFDAGLREAGVGDLTVPKRMRRLAGDFYARLDAYGGPLGDGDQGALTLALARNMDLDGTFAAELAFSAIATAKAQAAAPVAAMLSGDSWAVPAA